MVLARKLRLDLIVLKMGVFWFKLSTVKYDLVLVLSTGLSRVLKKQKPKIK